jgi:SH3-like domain-containing protein
MTTLAVMSRPLKGAGVMMRTTTKTKAKVVATMKAKVQASLQASAW